jgi:hypothetical protein
MEPCLSAVLSLCGWSKILSVSSWRPAKILQDDHGGLRVMEEDDSQNFLSAVGGRKRGGSLD